MRVKKTKNGDPKKKGKLKELMAKAKATKGNEKRREEAY